MSPEEWLVLVTLLQKQGPVCIAREDRKFLDAMTNQLAIDEPTRPLPWQERWLWVLKRECRL